MYNVARYLGPLFAALLGILSLSATGWAINDRDEILVGRISHIDGDLMRYVEETKDWTLTVPDAPFGLEDALYSGNNAKAEMIFPNETWMRIGEDTQVQMIDLNGDATTVDVASGLARLYNRSRDVVIKATTPFGYVVAPAGSAFDLYVGDESLEVIAVRGEVDFVHEASGTRYPVRQGGNSIIADRQTATQGNGSVDGSWDDWNNQRESVWAQRQQSRSSSANLLPAPIREDAYALEDNGRWERVYYDGDYRDMWRPTRVDNSWRPFTNGRWVDYYGDNCWIPSESFGYVTHHYGSWVYVDAFHSWYWMPPAPRRTVYHQPGLVISFGWYPGRVGWFHHGRDIGWVPLAPNEDYYGYRHWGHRTRVIRDHAPMIDLGRYHYLNHASIIDRDHLYRGDRYPRDIRRDVNKTVIINQYKPVTQWNDFRQDNRRFDFSDRRIDRKPHVETVERIRENDRRRKEIDRLDRGRIERDLQQVKVSSDGPAKRDIRPPINTSKIVDADKRTTPLDRGTLPTREFKPKERERAISTENRHGFDAGTATERRPENNDRINRRSPQEESQQRLRSPRDRQVEESGTRNFGENQPQERQRGPRDPQELRRSREEQRSGDGRPTFSREQELQGRGSKEATGKNTEEQLRLQRPEKAGGEEAQSGRLGAGGRDRFNRPSGDEQSDIQQNREGGERQRPERPDLRNQSQEEQRRRQGDERLQQQREQAQQQELQQRRQEEGLRRQQEQDRRSQADAREQEMQRDRQQQLRQQQEQQDQQQELQRRQQREQSQQQELMQRRQQEDDRRQQELLRNRQAEERQQEQQRERQQQLRQQQEEQQRERQQQLRQQQEEQQRERQQQMRQQQEEQQRERQQQMRRQQEEQQREQQQQMRRQQEQQQQEMQRRQQQDAQREQQQELQRQRQEQQRQQQQEAQRKKRLLTPEEQQKLNQSN